MYIMSNVYKDTKNQRKISFHSQSFLSLWASCATCTSALGGQYNFTGIFTIAPDYGVFNIYINGQWIASNLDLSNPVANIREIRLGNVNLRSGKNTLTVELVEYPKELSNSSFGIDKMIFK